ncbi:CDP-4-dehydro-6-deoxy-D-gulose 4-reductase [Thalassobaculum fulvum]|uniref:CDP-4-dehydro-6-deoxy-D-gulose 4-reductase n=1 Tax=Thalassobaculum fulvum TaxID=1633335 RepID=A0A918XSL9_9PROT|nr:NAD(P)-dependent oxidoreductase [Thalassobaculum fulvum]GHD49990.1 CDP-4-dehydro-6-deoxy-D-gulose 4-reductase [Thalassobaculum fulvum]
MSRVLLTGASGFVGRATAVGLLAAGETVAGVGRNPAAMPAGVTPVIADMLGEPDAVVGFLREARPETLIHAAWSTEHGRYWSDPANLDWTARTLGLVRAFVEAGGRRIVTIGTCAEYDWTVLGGEPCREATTPLRPHTLYGAAKHAMALLVGAYCGTTGVAHAHARLFLLYGDGEQPARLVPSLARSLLAGQPARTTSGRQVRDFMDVRDAGAAIAAIARSDRTGAVNVATGTPVPVRAVAETIGELTGRSDLLEFGALPDRPDDPAYLVADVGILTGEVGFRPTISLRDGLRHAVAAWRSGPGAADHGH